MYTRIMEKWLPIPSFPEYEASDQGRIRRMAKGRGSRSGLIRRVHRQNAGYLKVDLYINNLAHPKLVHRLIAETFLGPCPPGQEVNHRNLDKTCNEASNLEYVSRSENLIHSGSYRGERNSQAILDTALVQEIRTRHQAGEGYKRLGQRFGVSWGAIRHVIKGTTWSHVDSN